VDIDGVRDVPEKQEEPDRPGADLADHARMGGSVTEPVAPEPRHRRTVLAAVLAGLLLLGSGIGIGWGVGGAHRTGLSIRGEVPVGTVPQNGQSAQAIAGKVNSAVVDVNTVIYGFGPPGQPQAEAAGTGVVLTASGEVLTNNHVVARATSIKVTIQGYGTHPAKVIGADPTDDVALLQIGGVSGLPTATLADSSALTVGQRVIAIGNALGRGGAPTVSEGIISALGRSLTVSGVNGRPEHLTDLIQTDAPISPGESGGPLVNESGQVVGIITAAEAPGPFQGVSDQSFAIPVNSAAVIVNQIRSGQATSEIIIGEPGFMGVQVRNLDADDVARLDLGDASGALVVGVVPGTPAEDAGIPTDAVITSVDGQQITSADALGPAIYTHKPGERIEVTWVDRSGTHTASISLIAGPAI
jgi:S1-C subfamily serine protease